MCKDSLVLLLLVLPLAQLFSQQSRAQKFGNDPYSPVSNKWTVDLDFNRTRSISYRDGSGIYVILFRTNPNQLIGQNFGCGFYCRAGGQSCDTFLFAIFIVSTNSGGGITGTTSPQVVWSANRDRPVKKGATLELRTDGDLVLLDSDRSLVWSTGTSGRSVVGMNLMLSGNLQLVDGSGEATWQSFDHPSDVLLSGQALTGNQRLVAALSVSNWARRGLLYLSALGLGAYVNATPPQLYYRFQQGDIAIAGARMPCYLRAVNDTVIFISNSTPGGSRSTGNLYNISGPITPPPSPSAYQFVKLEPDGHLRLYELEDSKNEWVTSVDVFTGSYFTANMQFRDCGYPTVCGNYGICSDGKDSCRCPDRDYFRNEADPDLGFTFSCNLTAPLTCGASHFFLPPQRLSYFNLVDETSQLRRRATEEECKAACLKNCSCKAALFQSDDSPSTSYGTCYLPMELFSLVATQPNWEINSATVFIKVQDPPENRSTDLPAAEAPSNSATKTMPTEFNVGVTVAAVTLGVLMSAAVAVVLLCKKRSRSMEADSERYMELHQLPGMPKMFSHGELEVATDSFTRELGKGGFATVFEGTLPDGTKVAVKRLEGVRQMIKEFLAEVQIIGRIHHVNLLGLIGFCADKSHRMLVYEYMSGGSLERWIFHSNKDSEFDWEVRKKIIYQVAKGLLYLHEECSPKIIHLDIKPQNILLDGNFNAKVSDFGLSKLIDKDQSFVMTTMRGTPGYLAPEWLVTSKITEKVDVYSFGVLLVEIVCGRRNLDSSRNENSTHLLKLLNDMNAEGRLPDFVGSCCHGIECQEEEAMEMIRLAVWCLQPQPNQRPSMSSVIKVLEDTIDVPDEVDSNFLTVASSVDLKDINSSSSAPLMASVLSGPR